VYKLADVIHYTVLSQSFIFAVLKRLRIYDSETVCCIVYLTFAVLLHKFNQR